MGSRTDLALKSAQVSRRSAGRFVVQGTVFHLCIRLDLQETNRDWPIGLFLGGQEGARGGEGGWGLAGKGGGECSAYFTTDSL